MASAMNFDCQVFPVVWHPKLQLFNRFHMVFLVLWISSHLSEAQLTFTSFLIRWSSALSFLLLINCWSKLIAFSLFKARFLLISTITLFWQLSLVYFSLITIFQLFCNPENDFCDFLMLILIKIILTSFFWVFLFLNLVLFRLLFFFL